MGDEGFRPTYNAVVDSLYEACKLYEAMMDKGLSPSEVTRVTLAYEYRKRSDSANAMMFMETLDKSALD
ncbi:hypothetical protein Bca4012_082237 [Brassica carinata]|uniref:Pentatricopeptide repeat-containing protein n=1 Tax=Brassica carinata TaxID=52824 RepID=A0A8X7VCT0_BRACI|nr:hypothetical protein Bca52824_028418 [Brassica carinata]